jgi:ornithine carrier protein
MAAATKPDFASEPPPTLSVKGKEAIIDAMEDIVFGSVSAPTPP